MTDFDAHRIYELEQRLALVESKLEAISAAMNINFTVQPAAADPLTAELHELVAQGKSIEAIKRLREATGLGLADAKAQIDAMS